ncbi:hypothetical protein [Umezawaea sp.]|uniref:hypothetical protein n=1 Tax=Umezawaea sp. TaxID=1955258 RepID=UPI002ED61764
MDRPTGTGVVRTIEASRANLRRSSPASSGHSAIVYVTKRGEYVVVKGRLTMGELWLATPREVYAVDVSTHQDTFDVELPSKEEAFSFSAKVDVTWRVSDPVAAVRAQLDNPEASIKQHLVVRLRTVSRLFDLESSAAAEKRINEDHEDFEAHSIPLANGVKILGCRVVVTLAAEANAHIAGRTRARWERENIESTGITEQHSHVLELQRAEFQQKLDALKQKHDLDLKVERMTVYADALRTDNHNVLALRLSDHGEDVNDVIQLMMKQKQMEFDGANAVLNSLLEANLVNRKDIAAIMANASSTVIEQLQGSRSLDGEKPAGPRRPKPVEAVRTDQEEDEEDDG